MVKLAHYYYYWLYSTLHRVKQIHNSITCQLFICICYCLDHQGKSVFFHFNQAGNGSQPESDRMQESHSSLDRSLHTTVCLFGTQDWWWPMERLARLRTIDHSTTTTIDWIALEEIMDGHRWKANTQTLRDIVIWYYIIWYVCFQL